VGASLNIKIDANAVRRVVGRSVTVTASHGARVAAARAQNNIKVTGRVDSTAMYRGMTIEQVTSDPMRAAYLVYTPVPYAIFQELGTRAHGPKRAPRMVFKPKGQQMFVFAKWVRGVEPAYFMTNALKSLSVKDFLRLGR
jgi:hypothetical protein